MKIRTNIKQVIRVENVCKEFQERKREPGLAAAVKSLFSRKYEIKHALKNASLNVDEGEVIGLIGPNGAGKSTLIKIMTGVLFPTSGEVMSLGYIPWKQRVKYVNNIGVIFGQKSQLWWDIPALDTFDLHRELYGIPKGEYDKRLKYMVDTLEIKDVIRKPVRQLSLGERMRCELVLALLHNPKIAFLDEPTIGLDIIAKEKIRDFIQEFNRRYKTTFIITTHDMADIEKLCKRIVIINHGLVIYDGLLEEVRTKFANRKIIDCKFSVPYLKNKFNFKGCKIVKEIKHQLIIEVDLSKTRVAAIINHLMENYGDDIEDIDIAEPPIEEIIKLIYQKKE